MASNKAEFVIKLIDKLTAPARAISKAVSDVEKAEKAATGAGDDLQKTLNKVGLKASAMGAGATRGAQGLRKATMAMVAARRAAVITDSKGRSRLGGKFVTGRGLQKRSVKVKGVVDRATGNVEPVKRSWFRRLLDWNKAAGKTAEEWSDARKEFAKTPLGWLTKKLGDAASGAASFAVGLGAAVVKASLLTTALTGLAAGGLAKATIEMGMFAERSRSALVAINKSGPTGALAFKEAVKAAKTYNASVEQTVEQMVSLQRAGFGVQEALDIIAMGADMRALGSTADAVDRAVLAITQIRNTGKLQGDELMQLADAGISIDLVYKNLGKQLNKTTAQIIKMKEGGKITAAEAIKAIKQSILDTTGSKVFGDFGKSVATTTLTGLVDGIKAMPERMLLDLSERIDMGQVREIAMRLRDAFGGIDISKLTNAIDVTVKLMGKALDFTIALGEGFAGEFSNMIDSATGLNDQLTPERVREWGQMIGSALGKAVALTTDLVAGFVDLIDNVRTFADELTNVLTLLGLVQRRPGPPPLPTELGKAAAPGKTASDVALEAASKLSPLNNMWAGPFQPLANAAEATWTGLTGAAELKQQRAAAAPPSRPAPKVITIAPVIQTTVHGTTSNEETARMVEQKVRGALDDMAQGQIAEAF